MTATNSSILKLKILLSLNLLAATTIIFAGSTVAAPQPLRVVIIPSTNEVRFRETFDVALRVENQSQTNQTIRVKTGSWDEHWKCSNTNVGWVGWDAANDMVSDEDIPPGGALTNQLQMLIRNVTPDKEVSFRMGFTSIGSGKTLWSDKVKLHVLPPDTWARGGKYFRDRNHDGKIDWEVSGTTWRGHSVYPYKYITNSAGTVFATLETTGQGVDTYKIDTNFDGFYDLEYGAGGTNGQIQWTKPIHERVPKAGKDFIPVAKEVWMDWWLPK